MQHQQGLETSKGQTWKYSTSPILAYPKGLNPSSACHKADCCGWTSRTKPTPEHPFDDWLSLIDYRQHLLAPSLLCEGQEDATVQ